MSWQSIESAPKDGTRVLLYLPTASEAWGSQSRVCGQWCADQYAKKPRPYWTNDRERTFGTMWVRAHQPSHWQPLPAAPDASEAVRAVSGEGL